MLTRLRREERGFGLVELLMALTVLNVGILATVAAFNSGALALKRASTTSTAATIADVQMELYRGLRYQEIRLDAAAVTTADADPVYRDDPARHYGVKNLYTDLETDTVACDLLADGTPFECNPSRVLVGPDGRRYRLDVYVIHEPLDSTASRAVKFVTVVVRDGSDPATTLFRGQSTFDQSTGQ